MTMKKGNLSKSELRQQAEEKLSKLKKKTVPTEADALRLVHELEVYQIELEMQNEELLQSRIAAEAAFQQYADLYDFAPVGYFTLGRDGTIYKVNFSGANLLKTKLGELIKQRFGLFVSQPSRSIFNAFLEKVFVSGEKQTCEIELLLDDEPLWVQIEAVLETGQREMCRAVLVDISTRKQAEEEIRQLNASLEERIQERTAELREAQEQLVRHEKLAALGKMAGSMGHELRNPLGVISNAVYFLRISQPDASDKVKEYLNIIEQHMQISNRIVSDMLDIARSRSAQRETVSVSELINQALDYCPAPAFVRVILDLPADLPKIYADPQHVVQILSNLILNAYQSMISTDATRATKAGNLSISSRVQDDMIHISIQDSGVGIPPENMKKLFEPLFTTKIKGIGLGLAVSWELAEANGGKIEVQSEVGVGSVFTLCLPIQK